MWVSGSGKWTLIRNLKNKNIEWLCFIKSYVTRNMRKNEINGDVYYFLSEKEFQESIKKEEFLEYELVHKLNYYWTKKEDIINWLKRWKNLIKEVDIRGLKNIFKNNPQLKKHIISIFLDIPKDTLEKRILEREKDICRKELENRKKSIIYEKKQAKKICNHIIDTWNKTPKEVLEEVLKIIKKYENSYNNDISRKF